MYFDRVRMNDDCVVCSDYARALGGHATPDPEPEVPITMPNTNLPQSH